MEPEGQIGEWSIMFGPDGQRPLIYETDSETPIATVHAMRGVDDEFRTAMLIARAPAMRDALLACGRVFRAMRDYGMERERLTAEDMLPVIESVTWGLDAG